MSNQFLPASAILHVPDAGEKKQYDNKHKDTRFCVLASSKHAKCSTIQIHCQIARSKSSDVPDIRARARWAGKNLSILKQGALTFFGLVVQDHLCPGVQL